jgi:sensor histidine kinase YesM
LNLSPKYNLSGRNIILPGIIFLILTVLSIFVLSNLITQVTEESSARAIENNFLKRRELVQTEFQRFLDIRKELESVIDISEPEELRGHLKVFGTLQSNDTLVQNTWFRIGNGNLQFISANHSARLEKNLHDLLSKNDSAAIITAVVKENNRFFWRIYFNCLNRQGPPVQFGFDVDLFSLQSYFANIGSDISNYAFVFDEKGTILYHPEVTFLQKNVFQVTNLTPSDTVFINETFYERKTALSEYLKVDIVRYTTRLDVPTTHFYISASSPKDVVVENVNMVKKYASFIYVITTCGMVVFFYLFTVSNKKSFKEKSRFAEEKNKLLVENEKIKKEKALIQLQQIKEQINPHFLFNSLNSLYMLIESDTAVARKFTLNLSKIYRYLITPPESNIVTVQEELQFIEKYIFLHQVRFVKQFVFTIKIENNAILTKKVPYLSFQILIENAIKHNIASEEHPLEIIIEIRQDGVIISNTLNERPISSKGSQFGHKYLKSIYNYYAKNEFEAYKKDSKFTCILPLIG